jgi:Arm DNA-binding domain
MAFVHRYARGGVAAFPFTIGTYPEMSLEEAHEIHAANRRLLARGIDPEDERERLCHGQEKPRSGARTSQRVGPDRRCALRRALPTKFRGATCPPTESSS